MGRAPCCDKANVKKGPWSPEEDAKLKAYIEQNGTGGNWIALPQKIGLKRCGKSCRLRWLNYLRPNIKHGGFSEEEDKIICSLYVSIGSRWSIIAAQLPGRTDNDIKNYWNTRLKKKLLGKQRKEQHARRGGGGGLKQEMKRGNGDSSMVPPPDNNQSPCNWPELPVLAPIPYANEEQRLNDHESIRKLLIKLGGRFSDEDNHAIYDTTKLHQFPNGSSSSSCNQQYEQSVSIHFPSSSSSAANSMDALDSIGTHRFASTQYSIDAANLHSMLQGDQGQSSSSFPIELQEIVYSNPQISSDGMEFLYGDEMVNNRINLTSCESMGWGDMSSLICPPASSDYGAVEQPAMLQKYAFSDQLRYTGTQ